MFQKSIQLIFSGERGNHPRILGHETKNKFQLHKLYGIFMQKMRIGTGISLPQFGRDTASHNSLLENEEERMVFLGKCVGGYLVGKVRK